MHSIPYGKQLITTNDIDSVSAVLKSDYLTTGPLVREFERKIAEYCGSKYCVVVSNGTAALHLSSLVLLNKGDKVLTTPNSFLATSNSILYVGAIPKFVDIDSDGNIDLDICEKEIRSDPSIKAIYGVAFSGKMLNQNKLKKIRDMYGTTILEDCCHAFGARYNNIKAGSCKNSEVSIFSFHPVKHITTGEGGAITTNNKEIYDKLICLRNHGVIKHDQMKPWEYEMVNLGHNFRITDFQCALGVSQLGKSDEFINRRRSIAEKYSEAFAKTCVQPLYEYKKDSSSYHLYVVKINFSKICITREQVFEQLKNIGVGLQVHYIPINKQPYYKKLGYGLENTPVMNEYYQQCLSLPIYPSLTDQQQRYVIENLLRVVND